VTDDIHNFGSADWALIERHFTRRQRRRFTITKEVFRESMTATRKEVKAKELEFITRLRANDPKIGYNKGPGFIG
jgi:Xaa-Pro aminopeptidase